jgi:predicted PurR-regulated permease PerM
MTTADQALQDRVFFNRLLEATIRISIVAILAILCIRIVEPFLIPIIWGIIIAIASYPGYRRLRRMMGERNGIAATLFILLALIILIVPIVLLAGTAVNGIQMIVGHLSDGDLNIPPPPESIATWPVVGEKLTQFWQQASDNLESLLATFTPQLKVFATWLLTTVASMGFGILQFVVAIIIAGVLLANASSGYSVAHAIAKRLAGEPGDAFANLAEATVRSVSRGILGVAFIQSLLAGLGFLIVGVPGAGLWALLCLLLAVIQIGIIPINLPIVIYVLSTSDTLTAILFLIWSIFVSIVDNILKPLLLGRGVETPMLVIFLGTIGGFLTSGIIGLFIGPIILAIGYKLFLAWLHVKPAVAGETSVSSASSRDQATVSSE